MNVLGSLVGEGSASVSRVESSVFSPATTAQKQHFVRTCLLFSKGRRIGMPGLQNQYETTRPIADCPRPICERAPNV